MDPCDDRARRVVTTLRDCVVVAAAREKIIGGGIMVFVGGLVGG